MSGAARCLVGDSDPGELRKTMTDRTNGTFRWNGVYKVHLTGSLDATIEMGAKVMRHGRRRDMRKVAEAAYETPARRGGHEGRKKGPT